MPSHPSHSRPAHPHLAALPTLRDSAPASGLKQKARAARHKRKRGSLQLHRLDSNAGGTATGSPEADREAEKIPEDNPFHLGRTLAGRYRIEQLIGAGSMGVVVAALHLGLEERVAVKLIRRELRHDPLAIARFAREAKALARLKSAHVPRLFDVGRSLGVGPYIVMEYLEGRDLGELLRREGALEVPRAVDYVLEACEALAVAHASGITHQDIKPENLFLTFHGGGQGQSIKLLDFGISKGNLEGRIFGEDLSPRDAPAGVMGTPLYMSPERVRNDPNLDHRSDIWSLGVLLHELVSGRTPFSGESLTEICAQVLEDGAPRLATESLPPELEAVILRCLCRDPGGRYASVAELAAALTPLAPPRRTFFGRLSQQIPEASSPAQPSAARGPHGRLSTLSRVALIALIATGAAGVLGTRWEPTPLAFELRAAPASEASPKPGRASPQEAAVTRVPVADVVPVELSAAEAPPVERESESQRRQTAPALAPRKPFAPPRRPAPRVVSPPAPGTTAPSAIARVPLREARPRLRLVGTTPPLAKPPPRWKAR